MKVRRATDADLDVVVATLVESHLDYVWELWAIAEPRPAGEAHGARASRTSSSSRCRTAKCGCPTTARPSRSGRPDPSEPVDAGASTAMHRSRTVRSTGPRLAEHRGRRRGAAPTPAGRAASLPRHDGRSFRAVSAKDSARRCSDQCWTSSTGPAPRRVSRPAHPGTSRSTATSDSRSSPTWTTSRPEPRRRGCSGGQPAGRLRSRAGRCRSAWRRARAARPS